jgi:hypothetical protein
MLKMVVKGHNINFLERSAHAHKLNPTFIFSMLDEMLDAFDLGFTVQSLVKQVDAPACRQWLLAMI